MISQRKFNTILFVVTCFSITSMNAYSNDREIQDDSVQISYSSTYTNAEYRTLAHIEMVRLEGYLWKGQLQSTGELRINQVMQLPQMTLVTGTFSGALESSENQLFSAAEMVFVGVFDNFGNCLQLGRHELGRPIVLRLDRWENHEGANLLLDLPGMAITEADDPPVEPADPVDPLAGTTPPPVQGEGN